MKKVIVGAILLITVVAVKRKIAKLQNQIDVLETDITELVAYSKAANISLTLGTNQDT